MYVRMGYPKRLSALCVFRWSWLTLCLTITGCFATMSFPEAAPYKSQKGWFVTPAQAKQQISQGAIVLDVRAAAAYKTKHIKGAQHTTWQHFSEPKAPNQGRLLSQDSVLTSRLQALGISSNKRVLVYGDPIGGWGEDGRIVWMLRTFGHTQAAIVDGGYSAMINVGITTSTTLPQVAKGNFTIKRLGTWSINKTQLQSAVSQNKAPASMTLIDTRELREYQGAVPYGESRGGHVPGAIHLYYKDLLMRSGRLYDRDVLLARLKQKGIVPSKPVVAYCTGGIRSGWFVAVLYDLGFKSVKNYAGSMWEWASQPASQYPLVKTSRN